MSLLRHRDLGAIIAIGAAVVVMYGHTLGVPWYFDDFAAIVNNPAVHDLAVIWDKIGQQRWVALLSFAVNYRIGGLQLQGYHLVNIAIHLLAASVVFLLMKRIFRDRFAPALFGAMLFAAHPLQTQAITYVVQRMASLCGLLFLLSLYFFVRAREVLAHGTPFCSVRHLLWYGGALTAATLAAVTKENAIVLPFALLLFARFFPPAEKESSLPLRYVMPFLAAPALLAAQSLLVPLAGGDEFSQITGFYRHGTTSSLRYLVTEFSVLWIYLRLLFFPYGQALDYGYPLVQSLFTLQNLLACAGLAGLLAVAWRLRRRQPAVAFGMFWFFLTLAVESSIIPLDPIFEHRLYLPLFGFAVLVTDLMQRIPVARLRCWLMVGVVLTLAVLTWQRNRLWNDPFAFYEDNLRHAPRAQVAWSNLFGRYVHAGRLDEAERLLQGSQYAFYDSYLTLARAFFTQGQTSKARRYGEAAVAVNPAQPAAYLLLAEIALGDGEAQQATDILRRGRDLSPNNLDLLRRIAALQPADLQNRLDLALALYNQGKAADALQEYVAIARTDPDNVQALFNAGVIAFELGDQALLQQLQQSLQRTNPEAAAELHRTLRTLTARLKGEQP